MHADLPVAPDLPDHRTWLNTPRPLSLYGELWGHVVVICFWSRSDEHSWVVLRQLGQIAAELGTRPFVVVTVHAPVFPCDADEDAVRRAIVERRMRLPVLIDEGNAVWSAYECRSWPTVLVLDGEARVCFRGAGELDVDRLQRGLRGLLDDAEQQGLLVGAHLPPVAPPAAPPAGGLCDPGQLTFDSERGWLWLAETGRARVLAFDASGAPRAVLGGPEVGAEVALHLPAEVVGWRAPTGVAVAGDRLFVSDREGGVWSVDLRGRTAQLLPMPRELHVPIGLAFGDAGLLVAAAGNHQIWRWDAASGHASVWAGTGRARHADGDRETCGFVQPVAVAVANDGAVAAVDALASALRVVDAAGARVETLVGRDDAAFGDADGGGSVPRLQWPGAVCALPDGWAVVDRGNHKLRVWAEADRTMRTVLGPAHGMRDPRGVGCDGTALWVVCGDAEGLVRVGLADGAVDEVAVALP